MATREERCRLVWQVLVSCASNRQTILYSDLVSRIGEPRTEWSSRRYLEPIAVYSEANCLPDHRG